MPSKSSTRAPKAAASSRAVKKPSPSARAAAAHRRKNAPKKVACVGTTKRGTACKAAVVKGTDRCLVHTDEDVREKTGIGAGFGGAQPNSGPKPRPRIVDVLRERMEEKVDDVLAVYIEALVADKGIAVGGSGRDAYVEFIADHPTRLRAADAILDRVYGKAKQTTELTGPSGGPVELAAVPQSANRAADVAAILRSAGALPPGSSESGPHEGRQRRTPGTVTNGNGNGNGHNAR